MQTITQSFIAVFAAIELYLAFPNDETKSNPMDSSHYSHNNERFPDLRLNNRSQNIFCGPCDAHLPQSRCSLIQLLLESPDGMVSFDDSCDEVFLNGRKCPWRNGLHTTRSTRRCTASRLSTDLWLAGIPYKVKYSKEDGDVFILIPNPLENDSNKRIPITVTTTHRIFDFGTLLEIKKMLKALKTQVSLLQKNQYHELADPSAIISPVLSELPNVNTPSKT